MATTVLDLIKAALRLNNIIASDETPTANMATDCRQALNFMLDEWSTMGLVVYVYEEQSFTASIGTSEYSIGSGQTWDGNRPLEISHMIARDTTGVSNNDYYMTQVNQSDFMDLTHKATNGRPRIFYYEQTFPYGNVKLFPTPDKQYTMIMANRTAFSEYTSNDTNIELPQGYLPALKFNLAVEIAGEFEMEPSIIVQRRAMDTLKNVKRLNNLHRAPRMRYKSSQPGMNRRYDYRTGGTK